MTRTGETDFDRDDAITNGKVLVMRALMAVVLAVVVFCVTTGGVVELVAGCLMMAEEVDWMVVVVVEGGSSKAPCSKTVIIVPVEIVCSPIICGLSMQLYSSPDFFSLWLQLHCPCWS